MYLKIYFSLIYLKFLKRQAQNNKTFEIQHLKDETIQVGTKIWISKYTEKSLCKCSIFWHKKYLLPRLGDIWYIILFYDCPKELWEKRQGSGAMGILYFASFVGKNSTLPKYLIHIFDHLYFHLVVRICQRS